MSNGPIVAIGSVGLVAMVGAVLVAISNKPEYDYAKVCQDASYVRIEDTNCGNGGSYVMYISTSSNYNVPPVGGTLNQKYVVRDVPPGKTIQQNKAAVPKEGGVVKSSSYISRGGFGGKSGSAGG